MKTFVNRVSELKKVDQSQAKLIVLSGRRRIGKTALMEQWVRSSEVHYTQALEGSESAVASVPSTR